MRAVELPGWKTRLSWVAAVLLAVLFLASGLWKISDTQAWAQRITQLKLPGALSVPLALLAGIAETLGAVLVLVPRFRRWGAILIGLLLIAFMGYFAVHYSALRGADCSCFPWIKRAVGPQFFLGDLAMLGLALVAGWWSRPPGGLRTVAVIAGAVAVFALVSYGVTEVRQSGTRAPASILVDGQPYDIAHGKYFLFFFNPACSHCFDSAKRMATLEWGQTRVVAVPVELPQYAPQFLTDTRLKAVVTSDFGLLKRTFGYTAYPFGVAVDSGREKAALPRFDETEPAATLRRLGFVK
ncbi:MAG: DoxX family protein [Bryobacteraceae bacterium]